VTRTNWLALALIIALIPLTMPRAVRAGDQADGCAKIAAAIEESGGESSAEEIAAKLKTDVETVRSCWKKWEDSKKAGGAKPAGH